MRLRDMITNDTKEALKKVNQKPKRNTRYIDPEELEYRNFKFMQELMGMGRQTYERRNGRIRSK
jgi:hypothetical protein